jgi:ATP-dependent RNA helicase DDX46/PRP5
MQWEEKRGEKRDMCIYREGEREREREEREREEREREREKRERETGGQKERAY